MKPGDNLIKNDKYIGKSNSLHTSFWIMKLQFNNEIFEKENQRPPIDLDNLKNLFTGR